MIKLTNLFESLLLEDKREHVIATYGEKLLGAMNKDSSAIRLYRDDPDSTDAPAVWLVDRLHKMAGPNGKHLVWVARLYSLRKFRLEDYPRLMTAIEQFEQVKSRLANKDLNTYQSLADLEDAVEKAAGTKSKRAEKQEIKTEGAEIVLSDGPWVVVKLKTEAAAKFYGKGTRWCTAAEKDSMFNEYNSTGPVYVIINKELNRKWQAWREDTGQGNALDVLWEEDAQLMDERDEEPGDDDVRLLLSNQKVKEFVMSIDPLTVLDALPTAERIELAKVHPGCLATIMCQTPGRKKSLEPTLLAMSEKYQSVGILVDYHQEFVCTRWKAAELLILKYGKPDQVYTYFETFSTAQTSGFRRWREAEPKILQGAPSTIVYYYGTAINGIWNEAEEALAVWLRTEGEDRSPHDHDMHRIADLVRYRDGDVDSALMDQIRSDPRFTKLLPKTWFKVNKKRT